MSDRKPDFISCEITRRSRLNKKFLINSFSFYTTVNHLIRTKTMSALVIHPEQRVHTTKLLSAKRSSRKGVLMYV